MLDVQKYLREIYSHGERYDVIETLEILKAELGIKYKVHPELPLVILNYDSIDSPKAHPIVIECRGLVLELDSWDVVARGFGRFFNYGEVLDITDKFEWDKPFECYTKEDGSYINFFWYKDQWIMSTRGSWGEEECGFSGKTWKDLVLEYIPKKLVWDGNVLCNYIFEFTSIHNKIVRIYPENGLILLGIMWNEPDVHGSWEVASYMVDMAAEKLGLKRPIRYNFNSAEGIRKFLSEQAEKDPTFEGVVVRDCNGLRLKCKSLSYCALHHMKGEGDNMWNVRYIVPLILNGETEEFLAYFPEVEERFKEVKEIMDNAYSDLWNLWYDSQLIEGQREFAEFIQKKTPFASILFKCRKEGGQHQPTDEHLKEIWKNSAPLILKSLFGKKRGPGEITKGRFA